MPVLVPIPAVPVTTAVLMVIVHYKIPTMVSIIVIGTVMQVVLNITIVNSMAVQVLIAAPTVAAEDVMVPGVATLVLLPAVVLVQPIVAEVLADLIVMEV